MSPFRLGQVLAKVERYWVEINLRFLWPDVPGRVLFKKELGTPFSSWPSRLAMPSHFLPSLLQLS